MAVECGLEPKLTYSAAQTAFYTGIPYDLICDEARAGRLRAKVRRGSEKGYRIRPEDVDEWLGEDQ